MTTNPAAPGKKRDTAKEAPAPAERAGARAPAPIAGERMTVYLPVEVTGPEAAEEPQVSAPKGQRQAARAAYMKEFGQRAKLARDGMEVSEAAAAIGVHRNTIWNIERGDSLPDAFDLLVMAKVFNCSVDSLIGEYQGHVGPMAGAPRSVQALELGPYIYVPHFDLEVSAGPGAFHNIESVIAMRPFDVAFIRGDLGIQHNELAMCSITGTSAMPDLKPRDTVMVDLRDRSVAHEGMHIVRLDDQLMLKKLQRLPGKVLRVSSANPEYPPFDIGSFDESQRDFEVIGRVRWGGITY